MEENWRRLESDDRLKSGDESWCDCGHWIKVPEKSFGKMPGFSIYRRPVTIMNGNPTDDELLSFGNSENIRTIYGTTFSYKIPGSDGNCCKHKPEERINPDPRLVALKRGERDGRE